MRVVNCTQDLEWYYHRLNSSSDSVNGDSYGHRQISTPYKISTPQPIEKKLAQLITRPQGYSQYQIWYKSTDWGLLGKWVKYNKNYFNLVIDKCKKNCSLYTS